MARHLLTVFATFTELEHSVLKDEIIAGCIAGIVQQKVPGTDFSWQNVLSNTEKITQEITEAINNPQPLALKQPVRLSLTPNRQTIKQSSSHSLSEFVTPMRESQLPTREIPGAPKKISAGKALFRRALDLPPLQEQEQKFLDDSSNPSGSKTNKKRF